LIAAKIAFKKQVQAKSNDLAGCDLADHNGAGATASQVNVGGS
jgi:hypothetical protein